jgi:hypothetical protein
MTAPGRKRKATADADVSDAPDESDGEDSEGEVVTVSSMARARWYPPGQAETDTRLHERGRPCYGAIF